MAALRRQIMTYATDLQVGEAPIGLADRAAGTRAWTRVDWVAIGVGVLIALAPFLFEVPDNHVPDLRSALVGVSVWGAP
jgi:hypothetical protein